MCHSNIFISSLDFVAVLQLLWVVALEGVLVEVVVDLAPVRPDPPDVGHEGRLQPDHPAHPLLPLLHGDVGQERAQVQVDPRIVRHLHVALSELDLLRAAANVRGLELVMRW